MCLLKTIMMPQSLCIKQDFVDLLCVQLSAVRKRLIFTPRGTAPQTDLYRAEATMFVVEGIVTLISKTLSLYFTVNHFKNKVYHHLKGRHSTQFYCDILMRFKIPKSTPRFKSFLLKFKFPSHRHHGWVSSAVCLSIYEHFTHALRHTSPCCHQ